MKLKQSVLRLAAKTIQGVTQAHLSGSFSRSLFLRSVAALALTCSALGQAGSSTGTIRGTVTDSQGAVVPNANVIIKNTATGTTRNVATLPEGTYQAVSLNPGTYSVQVVATGFDKLVADEVVVTVGETVVYDAHLKVGGGTTVVEVSGNSAPLIDAAQSQQANTIDNRQEVNLPNISRNYAQTIYTLPGVVDSTAPSVQDSAIGTGYQSSGFSFGGGNGRSNLFTIDGGENDFGSGAQRVPHVPQDSVQEFQVNRNGENAEFGFTVGSAINVVTKSGTNKYHGSAFGYFHDQRTDAENYFNSFGPTADTKPFEQSAIFGGSLGGFMKKDKLFFFTSYERQKLDSNVTTNLIGTAAAQGVSGQTNGFAGGACPAPVTQACYLTQLRTFVPALAPFTVAPFFSPINDPIYRALVSANSGTFDGNADNFAVQAAPNQDGRYNNWVTRLDYQPNETNSFSLRFSLSRESNQVIGPGGVPRFTSVLQTNRDYTITTNWNHIFNPNLVNTVRVQVVPDDTTDNVAPHPGGTEFDLGSLGPVGTIFDFPYNQKQNRYQFDDDLTLTRGSHNLKFGMSYRPVQYNIFQAFLFGGQYQYFDGAVSILNLLPAATQAALAPLNQLLGYPAGGPPSTNLSGSQLYVVGLPLSVLQGGGNGQYNATTNAAGIYAQDSWKARKNLTLNYGVRYDIDPQPNGYPTTNRVSPRLGLAYDPFGQGKTIVRASGGLFTAPVPFIVPFTSTELGGNTNQIFASAVTAPSQIGQLSAIGQTERSLATPANPNPALTLAQFGALGGQTSNPGNAFFSLDPNFKALYSIQAGASVEQELAPNLSFELGYLLYRGIHIQQIQEANYQQNTAVAVDPYVGPQYVPKPGSTFGEPNANIIQNNQTTSAGSSTYHALTSSLTKRFGHGLSFQANYTWSKSIDNTSDFSSQSTPFRPGLLNLDRAISSFDIRHSFVANAVYQSPRHFGTNRYVSAALSNFTLAPIVSIRTGVPFTLLVPGITPNGTQSAHTTEARPFHEPRNQGIGPSAARFDMRVSRGIPLKRDSLFHLEAIAQAQNVLNHTIFTSVSNIFPNQPTVNAAGVTTSAVVSTPEGNVDLLNGPYRYRGFRPATTAQLNSPLAFRTAGLPRQISFGLELTF